MRRLVVSKKYREDFWNNIVLDGKRNRLTVKYFQVIRNERFLSYTFLNLGLQAYFLTKLILPKAGVSRVLIGRKLFKRNIKRLRFFYKFDRKYKFKNFLKKHYKSNRNFGLDIINCLEMRLSVLLYRLKFTKSIYESCHIIKESVVLVNKKIIRSSNFIVQVGDILEIGLPYKLYYYERLKNRIIFKKKVQVGLRSKFYKVYRLIDTVPSNLEVNYRCMTGIVWSRVSGGSGGVSGVSRVGGLAFPFGYEKSQGTPRVMKRLPIPGPVGGVNYLYGGRPTAKRLLYVEKLQNMLLDGVFFYSFRGRL